MGIAKEFREFAMRGNVVDLAVGVVVGTAFSRIVSSLVGDIVMPVLGKGLGSVSFDRLGTSLGTGPDGAEIVLKWGAFLQAMFDFLLIAFALFMVVKAINSMKRSPAPATPPPPTRSEVLLQEIRDSLKLR